MIAYEELWRPFNKRSKWREIRFFEVKLTSSDLGRNLLREVEDKLYRKEHQESYDVMNKLETKIDEEREHAKN